MAEIDRQIAYEEAKRDKVRVGSPAQRREEVGKSLAEYEIKGLKAQQVNGLEVRVSNLEHQLSIAHGPAGDKIFIQLQLAITARSSNLAEMVVALGAKDNIILMQTARDLRKAPWMQEFVSSRLDSR